jgi:TM2 domain-containing membrane protein YozV
VQDEGPGVPPQPEGSTPPPVPPPPPTAAPPFAPPVAPPMAPPVAPQAMPAVQLQPGVGEANMPMMAPTQGYASQLRRWDGQPLPLDFAEKKMIAGILGILLGSLGVHKFVLGYNQEGAIMLGVTIVSWVLTMVIIGIFGVLAMSVIGLIEGIMYLTKSDEEFVMTYGINKKAWF